MFRPDLVESGWERKRENFQQLRPSRFNIFHQNQNKPQSGLEKKGKLSTPSVHIIINFLHQNKRIRKKRTQNLLLLFRPELILFTPKQVV